MSPGTGLAERLEERGAARAYGLTAFDSERLERFAAAALTGILARGGSAAVSPDRAGREAVAFARALLESLNEQYVR